MHRRKSARVFPTCGQLWKSRCEAARCRAERRGTTLGYPALPCHRLGTPASGGGEDASERQPTAGIDRRQAVETADGQLAFTAAGAPSRPGALPLLGKVENGRRAAQLEYQDVRIHEHPFGIEIRREFELG